MCLRFVYLLITRASSWLRLSWHEETWKTAEILILRHQLAVLQRRQPRRPDLNWADRALIATLLGVIQKARRHGLRLLVTPDTILRWHRDITHGVRYFHGCCSIGDDQLWGITREHKGTGHTLAALKSIRAARPGGYRLFIITDYVPRDIIRVLCPAALCAAGRANRGGGPARGRGEGPGGAGLGHIILQSDESQLSSVWSERQTGVVRDPAEVPGSSVARRAASLVRVLISA